MSERDRIALLERQVRMLTNALTRLVNDQPNRQTAQQSARIILAMVARETDRDQ